METPKKKNVSIGKALKNYGKLTVKRILLSKQFHIFFKVCSTAIVFALVSYGAYVYINSTVENDVVVSKSEIIARVAKLTSIPSGNPDAVVRVEDPETLKKQNSFYENVKTGDYILIYPNEAIVYDLLNNTIVSVKKTQE